MAKKPDASGASLSGRPDAVAFLQSRLGHSSPHKFDEK
jgi:hypothetical protein